MRGRQMFIEASSSVFLVEKFCTWKQCSKVVVSVICYLIVERFSRRC